MTKDYPGVLCLSFPVSHFALSRILNASTVVRSIPQSNLLMRLKSPSMSFAEIKQPNRLLYSFEVSYISCKWQCLIYCSQGIRFCLLADRNGRNRTGGILCIRQVLSQLSYVPIAAEAACLRKESSFDFISRYHNITESGRFCPHFLFCRGNDKIFSYKRRSLFFLLVFFLNFHHILCIRRPIHS